MSWIIDGKEMTDEEYEEYERQEELAKERVRQEAATLMSQLGQTYKALTRLLEENREVDREVTDQTEADEEIYRKLRQNLTRANDAPRCRWVRQDGTTCGSPQMRRHVYCYAHKQMMETRAMMLRLPALEDANAIQISLMRVQKELIDDTITPKKAGLLLYSLQLAMTNVGQTTFGEADECELVTEVADEQEALRRQQAAFSQSEKRFTAEDAKDAKAMKPEKTLPLVHTDDTEQEALSRQQAAFSQSEKTFTAEDAKDAKAMKPEKTLPLMHTDDTDRRGLARTNGEEGGLERFCTENADEKDVEKKGVQKEIPKVMAMRAGGDD